MSNPYDLIRTELAQAQSAEPAAALLHLRAVIDQASQLLDQQLAKAVVDDGWSLRAAGANAGLTENAVGPRLARTAMLAPYASGNGRVTAEDVRRARYDKESGTPPVPADSPQPMRFKPRRKP